MQSIERAHRRGEGLQRAREYRRIKLDQRQATDQRPRLVGVRAAEATRMEPVPDLVFQ